MVRKKLKKDEKSGGSEEKLKKINLKHISSIRTLFHS